VKCLPCVIQDNSEYFLQCERKNLAFSFQVLLNDLFFQIIRNIAMSRSDYHFPTQRPSDRRSIFNSQESGISHPKLI
jgi:hypothetical protein